MASGTVQSGLQLYLRQINELPLLTADEEKALARRIIADNDPAARERMVRSNLRLVVNIAKHYVNRGLSLPDLIEEGNIGLLKAVRDSTRTTARALAPTPPGGSSRRSSGR